MSKNCRSICITLSLVCLFVCLLRPLHHWDIDNIHQSAASYQHENFQDGAVHLLTHSQVLSVLKADSEIHTCVEHLRILDLLWVKHIPIKFIFLKILYKTFFSCRAVCAARHVKIEMHSDLTVSGHNVHFSAAGHMDTIRYLVIFYSRNWQCLISGPVNLSGF